MQEQFGEMGKDLYAFGTTKIMINNEMVAALEEARIKAQGRKIEASQYIVDCFYLKQARTKYLIDIQKFCKLQRHIKKYFIEKTTQRALKFIIKAEASLVCFKIEKRKRIEQMASSLIGNVAIHTSVKEIMEKGIKGRQVMLSGLLKLSGRKKISKAILGANLAIKIFNQAWKNIRMQAIEGASKTLIQITVGYLSREKFKKQIAKAKEIAY